MSEEDRTGFTGTQYGMTAAQAAKVADIVATLRGWVEHGDCIGSDEEFHDIARFHGLRIAIRPPINATKRAFCAGDIIHEPKDYIPRNHDIVDNTDGLIAAPQGFGEELRSGTWATVRYAQRQGKPVIIVFPDGSVRE